VTRAGNLVRHLRHVLAPPEVKGASDAELLGRFVQSHDQTAFELLVRRHEALVFGVCRRIVRDRHDAEDAFQATFLALACKAGSIRKGAAVAGWLHRVACRVALQARAAAARRGALHRLEDGLDSVPAPREPRPDALWRDLKPILDEELSRLPEKLRVPVVLCYLQGKSYAEAARQLGCPAGTLSGRLTQARGLLARRLARRGVGASGAVLAAAFWGHATSAAARNVLVEATVQAAARLAAGEAAPRVVPADVSGLMEGVVRAMFLSKVKTTGLVLALALTCLALAGLSYRALAGRPAVPRAPQPVPADSPAAERPPRPGSEQGGAQPAVTERLRQPGEVVALEFTPNGKALVGYQWQEPQPRLIVWDAVTGETVWQLPVHGQGVNSRPFAVSPDGAVVAVVTSPFKVVCCDAVTGKQLRSFPVHVEGGIGPVLLRFSPDGKRLALALEADTVLVLDAVTGRRVQEVGGGSNTIFALAFSPDGKTLALGTLGPSIQLWDVATGTRTLGVGQRPRDGYVAGVAFSPDGKTLAAGRRDHIVLMEPATGREVGRLEANMGLTTGLAFTPDGRTLVSGSGDGKARVWDLRNRRVGRTLDGGAEGRCLALSPDGRTVALGTVRHVVCWDLAAPRPARPGKEPPLSPADLDRLWSDLAARDGPTVHQAIGGMLTAPAQAVALLGRRLRPAAGLDPEEGERLRRALAGLDCNEFAERERAQRELAKAGDRAAGLLRQTLAGNPSPEVKRRAERLLAALDQRWPASSPECLRTWRAIKVLEYVGTPEARQVLGKLARGAPADRLTQAAQAALQRLAKRAVR
jgi:RNA polymerase sigma factor (sigma-70 family)